MRPTLLILAAGMGSRYGGLKQVEGVGPAGEAILDYSIFDAIRSGFGKIVFIIRKEIEQEMKKAFFDRWSSKIAIDYVYQETDILPEGYEAPQDREKPWGTGHAIWVARDAVKEPFAVINADDFYGQTSYELAFGFLSNQGNMENNKYCLVGYTLKNTLSENGFVSRAECVTDERDMLASIAERSKVGRYDGKTGYRDHDGNIIPIHEDTVVSMNMWGFMPSVFTYLERDLEIFLEEKGNSGNAEFLLPDVIDKIIKNGEVQIPVPFSPEKWFGMTFPEDRTLVMSKLARLTAHGVYPSPVWG